MSISIIKPGLQATLQAAVRTGFRSAGIGTSGAMDDFAFAVANYLTGNDESSAVIEINFPAPGILFNEDALIAITGADFCAILNNTAIDLYKPLIVKKGAIIKFEKPLSGSKAYIAIHKGWQADSWLGSNSTNIAAATGGFNGRALQKNDIVFFEKISTHFSEVKILHWQLAAGELKKIYEPANIIRCIQGPEWSWLTKDATAAFITQPFVLAAESNNMGYCFNNVPLQKNTQEELVSAAVDAGTVQLLPNGNIIVLMDGCQTTGGYPRIAAVLKTDMPKLAQLQPGTNIHFKIVSLQEAETALLQYKKLKKQIKDACMYNLKKYFSAGY